MWSLILKWKLRLKGVKYGARLVANGPIVLRGEINRKTLKFGDDVLLQPYVDLKVRGNGKILIGNGVQLDFGSRIVAAENTSVELGERVQLGYGSIINGGDDVEVLEGAAIASNCLLQASEHVLPIPKDKDVVGSGYTRGKIHIGKSSWLAANVVVRPNTSVGDYTVIGTFSIIQGDYDSRCTYAGLPAAKKISSHSKSE